MTLTTAIANDFMAVTDGLETVSLKYPGAPSAATVTVTLGALRRAIRTSEKAASMGRYTTSDVTWHLDAQQVTTRPRLGTNIVDSDGVYWTIIDVSKETLSTRWRCVCRDLAIAMGPPCFVRIQRAEYSAGPSGAVQPKWRDSEVEARAWIELIQQDPSVFGEHRAEAQRCQITFHDDHVLDAVASRIVGPDGTVYKITQVRTSGLGSLMQCDAVVQPTPEAP